MTDRLGRFTSRFAPPVVVMTITLVSAMALSKSTMVGLYHDDGIYLAAARSLSEHGTYTLANLPGTPAATKYPPLYPALLAAVAAILPSSMEGIASAKTVSALALVSLVLVSWRWLSQLPGTTRATCSLGALLVGFNPGLLSHVDLLLSDVLFAALMTASLWIASRCGTDDRELVPARIAGGLAGLATLTRALGLVAVAAVLCHLALSRRWRAMGAFASWVGVLLVPWWLWRAHVSSAVTPLLEYYVTYEPQAWLYAFSDPEQMVRIVAANVGFFGASAGLAFGLPGVPLAVIALTFAALGGWRLRKTPTGRVMVLTTGFYLSALVAHPYPMARYLLPLVPIFWMLTVVGVSTRLAPLARVAVLVLLLGPTLLWLRLYAAMPADAVHGGFGRAMAYPAQGFAETAAWLQRCTNQGTRLASAHDPYYFLATGRQAVRPWIHRPETYTPAYGAYLVSPNPTALVQAELDAMGVTVLIRDPLLRDGEGEYGRRSIEWLVAQAPPVWHRVWISRDGQHEVLVRHDRNVIVDEGWCRL